MTSNRWDSRKKRRLAKNWPLDFSKSLGSSPSYTISDVLTAELMKGASESGRSSSKNSQPRYSRNVAHIAETELSVSIPALGPLFESNYYTRHLTSDGMIQNKQSSSGSDSSAHFSDAARRRHATLNQIPEQFSEFILEQNVVTDSDRTRQISDLMGSQATIFSTRDNDSALNRPSRFKSKSKSVKAGIDYPTEGYNRPKRRGAIRFKPGSKIYRAYVKMRRFASSCRSRFTLLWEFVAKSKRMNAKTQLRRLKLEKRRNRIFPKVGRGIISAPVNNPQLGLNIGAERVSALTDDVRNMAGMLNDQPNPGHPFHEQVGKLSHLSNYIKEQKNMAPVTTKSVSPFLADSKAPTPPPHGISAIAIKDNIQEGSAQRTMNDADIQQDLKPSSGLRVVAKDTAPQLSGDQRPLDTVGLELWNRYLRNVTALRIRLRQEIALFQALAAGQAVPDFFIPKTPQVDVQMPALNSNSHKTYKPALSVSEKLSNSKPSEVSFILSQKASIVETHDDKSQYARAQSLAIDSSIEENLIECKPSIEESETDFAFSLAQSASQYSVNLSAKPSVSRRTLTSLAYSDDCDVDSIDENVDKMQQVLNRRSMLGEMLDYTSDDDASTIASQTSHDTIDSQIMKRYGTILSIHGPNYMSRSSSKYSPALSTILQAPLGLTRSPGFTSNLHLVS